MKIMPAIHSRSQDARAGLDSFAPIHFHFYQVLRSGPMKWIAPLSAESGGVYKTLRRQSIYQFCESAPARSTE
jgi:hypothetical protein